ncbi:MAG TPA: response regulator transcription factor [Candidatus Absconditabacterales bacterium]|nr:response regulator transcription factor [Candidatus Absconditabacterales bacterium]
MKILLVEDNKTIAKNIKKYLEIEGYEVLVAENGLYGLEVARKNDFDIILLDLMLPGMDGIEICKQLKKEKDIPIIMTTAKGQLDDKLEGFDVGADDYLVKPFDLEELFARIKALSKRFGNQELFEIGDLEIDLEAKKVLKNNEEIKLTIKEFNILEILLNNIGIAISRTAIIEELWGGDSLFEGDGKLDVYISNIRKKLGKDFVETVKGFGYKIERN